MNYFTKQIPICIPGAVERVKSNIVINHQAIAQHLAKIQGMTLVESFGEEEGKAFFNLYDDKENFLAGKRGKSIKNLRKEVYKQIVESFST